MTVAAIYDIHGNLPALEAVMAEIEREQPALIVIGGDVAAGPMPGATIDRLLALGPRARFVRGNADREIVTAFDQRRQGSTATDDSVAARIANWAAGRITPAQRDALASFAEGVTVEVAGLGPIRFCHGSPRADTEIITAATPEERLRAMLAGVTEPVVVCGHTHMQFDRRAADKRVVNAGSVGMPYEGRPGAYWALLGPEVSLRRTVYDFAHTADLVRASGYPDAEDFASRNILAPPTPEEAIGVFEGRAGR